MKKYKGIVFDFNGTLFFDNDKHIAAWNDISLLLRGMPIGEEELHQKINGAPNKETIQYFTGGSLDANSILKWSLKKEEIYRELCQKDTPRFKLVDGVITFFDYLKKHQIPFTIASASIKENIDFFIESFHLDKWIDPQTIIYDNGTYENKIQMFKDACKVLGVSEKETLVFEDSLSGITNAFKAGITNIIVVCPKDNEDAVRQENGVVLTIQDFQGIVNKIEEGAYEKYD